MLLRLVLILSLIAQQALAFSCCGVQMLRPDIVRPDCQRGCTSIGACEAEPAPAAACCESEGSSGCGESAWRCAESATTEQPCRDGPGECTPPVDEKKQGPQAQNLDFVAMVAHPVLPPAWATVQWQRPPSLQPLPRWLSHHQRQAWLVLWLN
jgi:hypothetical protein